MAHRSRRLFNVIKRDPNVVYYFCTKYIFKEEAENWINTLPDLFSHSFSDEEIYSITTETHHSYSYQVYLAENTDDAASVYDTPLSGRMILEGDSVNKEIEIIDENNVDNCWKTPPVYIFLHSNQASR
eukprot:5867375-Ditylum_brightwellii.AAC.1